MLKLEKYKLFKRKMVLVLMTGIFLIVLLQEVRAFHVHECQQKQVEISEKHKGIFTDSRFDGYWKEFSQVYHNDALILKPYFFDGDRQKTVKELFPNASFDIYFGSYNNWGELFYTMTGDLKCIPIFIVLVFSGIFSYENECGMQEILLSTRNGRKRCSKAKLKLAFIVTNIFYFVVILIPITDMLVMTRGAGWKTSIQVNIWLSSCSNNINNLGVLVHTLFLSFLSINMVVLITLLISFLSKSPVISMCVSLGILYVLRQDIIYGLSGGGLANYIVSFTPVNVLDVEYLIHLNTVRLFGFTVQWLYIVEVVYVIVLAVLAVVFYKTMSKNQRYYAA